MRIVVTGASGSLGCVVMRALLSAGHLVVPIDRRAGSESSLGTLIADLTRATGWGEAFENCDVVVHLANSMSRKRPTVDPCFAENMAMNFNVGEAARLAGVRTLIFASTVQVMTGERRTSNPMARSALTCLPLDGGHAAVPSNPYALSKTLTEEMLRYYVRNTAMTAVAVRFPYLCHAVPALPEQPMGQWRLDEAFTWLTYADAARLVQAIVARPPIGFRIYFPAAPRPMLAGEVETLRAQYFAGVPTCEGKALNAFVDISAITRDTGWAPMDL